MLFNKKKILIFIFLFVINKTNLIYANEDTYFLTLKDSKVNVRKGPSFEYPIKFTYNKKYLPVTVIDSWDNFKKIKDINNNSGWIYIGKLSKKKSAINIKEKSIVFKKPTIYSKPLIFLANGRLVLIKKCIKDWCKIKTDKYEGWMFKKYLWGRL